MMKIGVQRTSKFGLLAFISVLAIGMLSIGLYPPQAGAALTTSFTFQGNGGYSADALGQNTTGNTIQADVPAGSTVVKAFLYGATFDKSPSIDINFDGTVYTLPSLGSAHPILSSYRTEVTTQVATKVGSGGGITNFAILNDLPTLDGVALVVIFSNPSQPDVSVIVLDGGLSSAENTTIVNYASPINKSLPGFSAIMSLGSSFSFQEIGAPSHLCGTGVPQSSIIDVNGQRLTSCAGNFDDAAETGQNGNLITVGGVGDSTNNPADPFQQPADGKLPRVEDDELYDISGFINTGDTQTAIRTQNPSGDDQIFLLIVEITAQTTSGENCFDNVDNDGDGLVDNDDPDCQVCGDGNVDPGEQCDDGNAVSGDGCSATCEIEADDTPPVCFISGMNPGPPTSISVTTQDAESGLAEINVLKSVNANTVVPPFTVGTNDPVVVTATKTNQSQSATVMLEVIDQQGNTTTCDPVLTLAIRENGKPVSQTFSEIPAWESNVTVSNGDPGINSLDVTVNGKKFVVAGLSDNEERTIDVSSAMDEGNNTIVLTAYGKPGASANVMIWGDE